MCLAVVTGSLKRTRERGHEDLHRSQTRLRRALPSGHRRSSSGPGSTRPSSTSGAVRATLAASRRSYFPGLLWQHSQASASVVGPEPGGPQLVETSGPAGGSRGPRTPLATRGLAYRYGPYALVGKLTMPVAPTRAGRTGSVTGRIRVGALDDPSRPKASAQSRIRPARGRCHPRTGGIVSRVLRRHDSDVNATTSPESGSWSVRSSGGAAGVRTGAVMSGMLPASVKRSKT